MKNVNKLLVYYHEKLVGTLAKTSDHKIAFQYDENWIKTGFSISPFSLPLNHNVFIPTKHYFNGLFGVFADSLPDAWGNILLNRVLKKHKINPDLLGPLERLAIVGNSGMGALSYRPEIQVDTTSNLLDLDELAKECQQILTTEYCENLDTLFTLGGHSGGARPKILTSIEGNDRIIKFPAPTDNKNIGKVEFDYYLCAKACGIQISPSQLFPSKQCLGYFGTTRFDRHNNKRIHMISVAALLEIDFRQPCLDYTELMKLTKILTKNNPEDILQLFKVACFNVFAHNRDDHAKNFSFIYDEENKQWHLSPAYDLTYSTTYYGEHTTTVCTNGANPSKQDLMKFGNLSGIKKSVYEKIIDDIYSIVNQHLSKYLK